MAARLPEDPILELDMLQLVIGEDGASTSVPTSPAASSHIEDLLSNCSVDVSIAVSTCSNPVVTSNASCSTLTDDSATNIFKEETNIPDEFTGFLLDNDQFLRDMEQVVKIEFDNKNEKNLTSLEQSNEFDACRNLDMMTSPCPSVPSTCESIFGMTDEDEFEMECPLLNEKENKERDEPMRKYHETLMWHVLPSTSSSPQLLPTDSSLSEMSETSLLGYTAGRVSASPLVFMAEKAIKDPETYEKVEEEAMEDEINLLEKEAKYLDAQVDFLQSRAKPSRRQRKSLKQRCSRDMKQSKLLAKSQEDNQLLINLIAQQKIYEDNLRAMLSLAPVNEVRMALMSPVESYIRLGKDLNERRKTIMLLRKEKLDMTYNFIEQKAAGLDFNKPYQYSDMFEKFGKQYCMDFAISKYEGVDVYQIVRAIYAQVAGKDKPFDSTMGSTTICESFDTIQHNFMLQRVVASMQWEGKDAEKMPDMESNSVFYCRFSDNLAVLASDYINQDELHPYDASKRIRRDMCTGLVLSGHTDDNGKKFVVVKRYLMAKFHMYPHKVSQEQYDRFFSTLPKCCETMKKLICDHLKRNETGC